MQRPICTGTKKNGQPCTYKSQPNTTRCGFHMTPEAAQQNEPRVRAPPEPEDRCVYMKWNREQCTKRKVVGDEHNECSVHRASRNARERMRIRRERFRDIWRVSGNDIFHQLQDAGGGHWQLANMYTRFVVWRMVDRGETEAEAILAMLPEMQAMAARFGEVGRRADAADTRPELQRISDDAQNTHNRNVRKQTDENVKLLLEISPPAGQKTLEEIRTVWTTMYRVPGRGVDERVYADMKKWYDTAQCYTPNDWMYRKVLDSLWTRIKLTEDIKISRELCKRLQQECAESFQMCCEGHIGRLANVLVGFDDTFRPQIPVGLILQQKMAVISQIENVDERFKQARNLMAELNVPEEQAVPWLDAIAE